MNQMDLGGLTPSSNVLGLSNIESKQTMDFGQVIIRHLQYAAFVSSVYYNPNQPFSLAFYYVTSILARVCRPNYLLHNISHPLPAVFYFFLFYYLPRKASRCLSTFFLPNQALWPNCHCHPVHRLV